jgi:hypothetical protein
LSQLDDQDRRQIGVPLDQREVELDEPPQLVGSGVLAGHRRLRVREKLGHLLVEEPEEQVVFSLEIQIDGAVGHAGYPGDLRHGRAVEPALGEHLDRRIEDAGALVVGPGIARLHRGRSPGWPGPRCVRARLNEGSFR